jgi:signal transduction histidine kinase
MHRIIARTETLPFVCWCVVGNGMFMQLLLQQKKENSYLWLPLRLFIIIDFFFGVGQLMYSALCVNYHFHYPFHSIHLVSDQVITMTDFLIVTSVMEKIVQRQRLALFYFFTTLLPVFGMLNFYLNTLAYTDFRFLYPNSIATGVMLEIIILTLMLTQRYNLLQQDKNLLLQQRIDLQRELSERVLQKQEEERMRIARDLHDGVVGYLGALHLYINTLILNIRQELSKDKLSEALYTIQKRVEKVITDIRNTSHDLMPADFDSGNFYDILDDLFNDLNQANDVRFTFIADGSINKIGSFIQINIYRVILELTNNILQHSKSTKAILQCFVMEDYILIQIEDDGIGFDKELPMQGIGLKSITYRIELMKGKISIDSNETGTIIIIEVPFKQVESKN